MTTLYVDADACPVKQEIERVADRHGLPVILVSNSGMRPSTNPLVRSVVVAEGPDAADDWIAERIARGDIAITADIPLAARCVEKGARALSPTGRPFTPDNIGMAVAMRDLHSHLRETGSMTGGGPAFGKRDRSNFLNALENAIQAAKRENQARS